MNKQVLQLIDILKQLNAYLGKVIESEEDLLKGIKIEVKKIKREAK